MNEEIQKWFTEHGRVISAEPVEDKASPVPGATVIRYTFEDGAQLTLRPAKYDNGTEVSPQQIVARELPKPKEPAAGEREGATRGPQTGRTREVFRNGKWVMEPNPLYEAKPGDEGEASDTKPVEGRPGWRQVTRKVVKDGKSEQETYYLDPEGNRQESLPGQATSATGTKPLEGQPGWQVGTRTEKDAQGNQTTRTYYINPQGQETATPPAARGERAEKPYIDPKSGKQYTQVTETDPANGRARTYFVDPSTGQEVTLDAGSNIKGVPPYTPDLTKPGAGLIDRARQLDELVQAGTITYQQRQEVLKNDQVLAQTVANEFNVGVTLLREDYANQTSQRNADVQTANTRASLSNQHMQNALGLVEKFLPYMGQTPGTATKLFTGMLAVQVAHATALGGLKDVPREQMHPNLRGYAERATAGAAGNAPAVSGATPPNAIGAGSVPSSITPGPAAAPALPEPIFRPMPEATPPGPQPPVGLGLGESPLAVRQPEDASWRQQAMDRRQVMMARQLLGGNQQPFELDPLPEATGTEFAPLPMVLDSQVPGITPEIDMLAKRELDASLMGGGW